MYRVEDKYICSESELYMLQARIGTVLRPDTNQPENQGYNVVSVYFDDLFDTHLQDTVDGCGLRDKYRIRIYNNSFDIIKLEVKSKKYNRVFKRSKNITVEEMQNLLNGMPIEDGSSLEDPATLFNIGIKTRGLRPTVIVAYERIAYIFDSGNVRITFDRNVRACKDISKFGAVDAIFDKVNEYPDVLEVKYDEFLPGFIAQLLELGSMQQTSYSKYRICREKYMR